MFSRIAGIFEKREQDGLPFKVKARQVNRIIGMVALGLPVMLLLTVWLTSAPFMSSISHFYFTRIGGDILVGGLSTIGIVLIFMYRFSGKDTDNIAHSRANTWLARLVGLCALGVAFFPTTDWGVDYPIRVTEAQISAGAAPGAGLTGRFFLTNIYGESTDTTPPVQSGITGTISNDFWASFGWWADAGAITNYLQYLHFASAGGMFILLCYFSAFVFTRNQSPLVLTADGLIPVKWWRNVIYYAMGAIILLALIGLFVKTKVLDGSFLVGSDLALWMKANWNAYRLTFWLEAFGLWAFGISWMVKGRFIKALNDPPEDQPAS